MPSANPSRSPSPVAPPPLPNAPGPRATALQNAFSKALEATLSKCDYANFAACFPTPAQHKSETLDGFWRQFVGKLEEQCKAQYEAITAERAVIPSLNSLDALIADARIRKERAEAESASSGTPLVAPVPPHTLPPEALLTAHLTPFLCSQHENMTEQLNSTRAANADLASQITAQRAEIAALLGGLEAVVRDLENAAGQLGNESEGLVQEIRGVEEVVGR